jgi:hypothetical protein
MAFTPHGAELDDLLNSDFEEMRAIVSKLRELEKSGDREVFEIAHIFANVASPIRGNIALGSSIQKIMVVCDYAKQKLEDCEIRIGDTPFHTVHSKDFIEFQKECLRILESVRSKILSNRHLLQTSTGDSNLPSLP